MPSGHIQPTSARFEIRGLPFSLVRGQNMPKAYSGVERICRSIFLSQILSCIILRNLSGQMGNEFY